MCAMPNDKASKSIDVSEIKTEPPESDVAIKVETVEDAEPGENNNTVPTLTALLNQPAIAPEPPTDGKETYMKLLNLKLSELAPVPLDVVRVNVDLDGDVNLELSIDERSDAEREADVKKRKESKAPGVGLVEKLRVKINKILDGRENKKRVISSAADVTHAAEDALRRLDQPESAKLDKPSDETTVRPKVYSSKDKEDQNDDSEGRKYTCLRCGFVTAVDDELRHHMLTKHEGDLGIGAPKHIRRKMGAKLYPCDKCDQVFLTPRLLHNHRQQHDKVKFFTCGKCDQAFPSFEILQKHQFEDQGGCLNAYRFSSAAESEQKDKDKIALAVVHPAVLNENLKSVNEKGEKTYICQHYLSCAFKTDQEEKLTEHMEVEHPVLNDNVKPVNDKVEKTHVCQHYLSCGFTTDLEENLTEHMNSVHPGADNQPFSCEFCNYTDYQYASFTAHRKQHLGPSAKKKVVCKTVWILPELRVAQTSVLPEANPDQPTVDIDDLSHGSDSSSVELRPSTPSKGKTPDKLANDSESSLDPPPAKIKKSEEKILVCDHCDYSTPKMYVLQRHMRQHTGEKPYSCLRCVAVSFSGTDGLRRHMKKHQIEDDFQRAKLLANAQGVFRDLEIEETDPLAGPPVPIPQESQTLAEGIPGSKGVSTAVEKNSDQGKISDAIKTSSTTVSSSEENTRHTGMTFPCEECLSTFPSYVSLKNHETLKHGSGKVQFACTKCKYKTKEEVLLNRHYLKRHASSAIPKKSRNRAAALVKMVSAGNKVACDSTTLDDADSNTKT